MMNNNLSIHTITRALAIITLVFSMHLFLGGHNNPGGGFIGGLMTASGILLLYLAFDFESVQKAIKINYAHIIASGLIIAILTGFIGIVFGHAYLEHFFTYVTIPFFGELELTTALPFDLGVYLVVVGITMLCTLTIAEDK